MFDSYIIFTYGHACKTRLKKGLNMKAKLWYMLLVAALVPLSTQGQYCRLGNWINYFGNKKITGTGIRSTWPHS